MMAPFKWQNVFVSLFSVKVPFFDNPEAAEENHEMFFVYYVRM